MMLCLIIGRFQKTLIKTASENENLAGVTYGAAVAVGGLALAAGAAALTLQVWVVVKFQICLQGLEVV